MSLVSEREGSTCPDPALLDRLPSLVQIHSGRPPNHERNIFTVALFPLFSIRSIKLGVMAPFMFGRGRRMGVEGRLTTTALGRRSRKTLRECSQWQNARRGRWC